MKKFFFFLVVFISAPHVDAASQPHILSSATTTEFNITHKNSGGFKAISSISTAIISEVSTQKGLFTELEISGYSKSFRLPGKPHLPVLTKMIELPQGATVKIKISSYDEELIDLNEIGFSHKLAPTQPSVSKSRTRNKVTYHYDALSYGDNHFNGDELIRFKSVGTMRGVRVGRLTISPLQYNPAKNVIKVSNNIDFEITFENPDTALTEHLKKKFASPAFNPAFKTLANYSAPASKDVIIGGGWPVTYVVVASDEFLNTNSLKSFITWKKKTGFNVIEANTTEIHTQPPLSTQPNVITTDELKTWLQDLYKEMAQSYVLFVGDIDQIPAFRKSSSEPVDHYTDLDYCDYTGDYLPDAYYGRFPAETATELANMINKTLAYEQYTMMAPAYLDTAILIAGVDENEPVSDATVFGNAQVAYGINEYFHTDNGFSEIFAYLFNETRNWSGTVVMNSDASGATEDLGNRIDEGAGFVNYTGHCTSNGWYDPIFETNEVHDLNNSGKYGFFIGNCCESSRYEQDDSLAEELLKAENKGAIGYIGSANNTYWDPDFFWAVGKSNNINVNNAFDHNYNNTGYGMYDGLWHTNPEVESDLSKWYNTAGQMIYAGNLSVTSSGWQPDQYYWEIYNLMGDPSLMPYLSTPSLISTLSITGSIDRCETSTLDIITEPNAVVSISQKGTSIDSKFSGSSGSVTLTVPPLSSTENAELIITKQNRQPKTETLVVNGRPSSSPVADFMAGSNSDAAVYNATSGIPVSFTSLTTKCPDIFAWTFHGGHPSTSSDEHPMVTYDNLGLFDVQLVAGNVEGNSPPELKPTYIRVSPNVNFIANKTRFTVSDPSTGVEVKFSDLSTNSPETWNWIFKGGTPETSTIQNPTVTYNAMGTYTVSLTITINGTIYPETGPRTKTNYISVVPFPPVADFSASATNIKGGDRVSFTDLSTNNPTQWAWTFQGGSPQASGAQNPIVQYQTAGTYSVSLIATNDGGNGSKTENVYITVTGSNPIPKRDGGGCFINTSHDRN